jgi:hypothetical protein
MAFCSECGGEFAEGAKFCSGCGSNLEGIAATPVITSEAPAVSPQPTEPPKVVPAQTVVTPTATQVSEVKSVWEFAGGNAFTQGWKCLAHDKKICTTCSKLAKHPARGHEGQVFPASSLPAPLEPHTTMTCAVGPCTSLREVGSSYCGKHGPKSANSSNSSSTTYTGAMGSRKPLSAVGAQTDHGLACPKCGGTQFVAKRSNKGKVVGFATLGVGGLVAPKSQVKCVTCGTMYKRG